MTETTASNQPEPGLARRVGIGMAWGQLGRIVELGVTTAIAILVVRGLAPSGFGTYALLTNLAGAASIFIPVVGTEALGAVLPRFPGAAERTWMAAVLALLRVAVIALTALAVIPLWQTIAATFGLEHVSTEVLVVAFAYWAAQDVLNSVTGLYGSELRLRSVAIWRAAGQTATLTFLVVVEIAGSLTVGRALTAVAGGYLLAAAGLALGRRREGVASPDGELVRFALGFTRNVWVIGVLTYLVATHVGVLVIGAITQNAREVAFYSAAIGVLGRAQLVLLAGWSSVMIPSVGAARQASGLAGVRRACRLFAELWLVVAVPLNLLLVALAQPLVDLLFGRDYAPAGGLLAWFAALSALAAVLGGPIGAAALWSLDRQSTMVRVRLAVAAVNVALAVLLVLRLDALGAVLAAGTAATMTALAELVLAARAGAVSYPRALAVRVLAAGATAAVAAWLVATTLPAGLALGAATGVLLYVTALRILRPFGPEHLELLRRISPRLDRPGLRSFVRP